MLARQYILKGRKNFERVQKEGRVFQSDSFGISVFDRGDTEPSRFAFVVSTKISKDATQRNRIKRAIGEAVRYERTRAKAGLDVVFLAKSSSTQKSTDGLMTEVREGMTQAGLIQ